jgi:hypothetical protein
LGGKGKKKKKKKKDELVLSDNEEIDKTTID